MNVAMSSLTGQPLTQPQSPELALVDPELRAVARSLLPLPSDSLACARSRPVLEQRAAVHPTLPTVVRAQIAREGPMFRVALALAAVLAAVLGMLAGAQDHRSRTAVPFLPPAMSSATIDPPAVPTVDPERPLERARRPTVQSRADAKPTAQPKRQRPASPSRLRADRPQFPSRRFAWAPVAAASGYRFELFRGPNLVYRRDTTEPQLVVPRAWNLAGRKRTLTAGAYRWYVWPVVDGRRAAQAVVQAELRVRT